MLSQDLMLVPTQGGMPAIIDGSEAVMPVPRKVRLQTSVVMPGGLGAPAHHS